MSPGIIFRKGFPEKSSSNLLSGDKNNEQNLDRQVQEGFEMEGKGTHWEKGRSLKDYCSYNKRYRWISEGHNLVWKLGGGCGRRAEEAGEPRGDCNIKKVDAVARTSTCRDPLECFKVETWCDWICIVGKSPQILWKPEVNVQFSKED